MPGRLPAALQCSCVISPRIPRWLPCMQQFEKHLACTQYSLIVLCSVIWRIHNPDLTGLRLLRITYTTFRNELPLPCPSLCLAFSLPDLCAAVASLPQVPPQRALSRAPHLKWPRHPLSPDPAFCFLYFQIHGLKTDFMAGSLPSSCGRREPKGSRGSVCLAHHVIAESLLTQLKHAALFSVKYNKNGLVARISLREKKFKKACLWFCTIFSVENFFCI